MKDWKISYEDESGDLHHVWETAKTADDAEQQARQEYWDIHEVIQVVPL